MLNYLYTSINFFCNKKKNIRNNKLFIYKRKFINDYKNFNFHLICYIQYIENNTNVH